MLDGDNHLESTWEWLKKEASSKRHGGFTAQVIDERRELTNDNLDALWHFAIAGIIRPQTDTQFTFTDEGRNTLEQDVSPYQSDKFLDAVEYSAPLLDTDSKGYLSLALSCIYQVPAAAVVLSRVALEIEVDSLIATCIDAWNPKSKARQELNARDLGRRSGEIVSQLRNRDLQTSDDNVLFDAHIKFVRITANRVLHPSGGRPITNPKVVQAVLHHFKEFAELTSVAKTKVRNSPASAVPAAP